MDTWAAQVCCQIVTMVDAQAIYQLCIVQPGVKTRPIEITLKWFYYFKSQTSYNMNTNCGQIQYKAEMSEII